MSRRTLDARPIFLSAVLVLCWGSSAAAEECLDQIWSLPFTAAPNSFHSMGTGVTDASGNLYLCGVTKDTIWMGGQAFSPSLGWGLFIADVDADGDAVSFREIAATDPPSMGPDCSVLLGGSAGGWFVGGSITDSTLFDSDVVAPTGGADMFVARFDADWGVEWIHLDASPVPFSLRDLASDAAGNSFVAGSWSDTVQRLFLRKLDSAGDVVWQLDGNDSSYSYIYRVDVTTSGDILCAGWTEEELLVGIDTIPAGGFLATLDTDGGLLWSTSVGGQEAFPWGITADGAGSTYVTGRFWPSASFPDTTFSLPAFAYPNGFVAKYDWTGSYLWARELPGAGLDREVYGRDVDILPDGSVLVSGESEGVAFPDTILAGNTAFIARFDSEGNYLCAFDVGNPAWFDDQLPQSALSNGLLYTVTAEAIQQSSLSPPTAVPGNQAQPRLSHSFGSPNPFNPSTSIHFELAEAGRVVLSIYDLRGTHVRQLLDAHYPQGKHMVPWNGLDDAGRLVATGVYLYRLQAGAAIRTGKLALVK